MKTKLLMNPGCQMIVSLLTIISLLMLSSCIEEPQPKNPGMNLPSDFFSEWKNEDGEIIYEISERSIIYKGVNYEYEATDVSISDGIYLINLSSIDFFISEGTSSNELFIGTNTSLSLYYKEIVVSNEYLPADFHGHWYAEDGYTHSAYFIAEDYIKTASIEFAYSGEDVIKNGSVYTVVGTSANGTEYTFIFEMNGEQLNINRNNEGTKTYWNTQAIELPHETFDSWYNYAEVWRYEISINQDNPYAMTGNVRYYFGPRDVYKLEDDVYKIKGMSNGNEKKTFFVKHAGSGELFISTLSDYENTFKLHWNDKTSIPKIDEFFFKKWFEIGASSLTFRLYVNQNGNNILRFVDNGNVTEYVFDPEKGDVGKLASDRFEITASITGGSEQSFFIKRNGTDDNSVNIGINSESNYLTYYHVTGRNIQRGDHETGSFRLISGTTWGEYNDSGELLWEIQEIGRSDWEVRLEKWSGGDQVVISMHQKYIFYVFEGTTEKVPLYELTGYGIEP